MGHDAVVHPHHPDRCIKGDCLLPAVSDGEVFQCHIGAGDGDDGSVSFSLDARSIGHSDEGERLVDVDVATQGTGREMDRRSGWCPVDCFLEGFCRQCCCYYEKNKRNFLEFMMRNHTLFTMREGRMDKISGACNRRFKAEKLYYNDCGCTQGEVARYLGLCSSMVRGIG